ncbi:serine/threonine-protein kinase [Nannocystis bainbridge]|uniref:Protein kinase n=1 Tax=Nannocystis bainbridge TaxID=2995303 RepID=A0ABT5EAY1_9BACT|nr:serine/threonine-protein kinase [Nannocystis bainbridge]MDC0721936.1 protein kinase [Nannocystis bainbridge]
MVKQFDPLDKTLLGEGMTATPMATSTGPLAASGELYAGRYRVERLVGRGGMGVVYRAVDAMVGDVVALKVLDIEITRAPDQLEWFRREVRLARRITHPNVARTHDMGEAGGTHFITMEFIEGTTLQDVLRVREDGERRRLALEPARTARVMLAVCEGLAAAHAAGVVHRDLKPANILIENTGRVVLTDFGIARALTDEGGRTQGLVGTPLYMSPEQVSGKPVDTRTDVYAVGLMLFEMLTGTLPFAGEARASGPVSPLTVALARLTQPPPDPRTIREDVPPLLGELVLQCMAQEPDERPAGAVQVAERLRAWLISVGESAAPQAGAPLLAAMAAAVHREATTIVSTGGALTPSAITAAAPSTLASGRLNATAGGSVAGATGIGRSSMMPTAAMRSLAPVPSADRALAVLPFRYQGPPDQSYLGDALSDELIDVLSRTRGLRVLGSGATAQYRDNRDPRAIGTNLGVDAVVDATVQCSPSQIRVLARLVEVATGTQLWSDRFESRIEDVFEMQDRMSKRIAEALRVELNTVAARGDAPAEAVALYLRARRKITSLHILGEDGAIELLEGCMQLAPEFRPALASYAVACMRAWFLPAFSEAPADRDWAAEARRALARALADAADLAETHLAKAMLAVQTGEWRDAVQALVKALEIAPTYAHAHQYLAQLQCEAGNTREGVSRARLAVDLEPRLFVGLFDVARVHALRGELGEYEEILRSIEADARYRNPTTQIRLRVAGWYGDMDRVRDVIDSIRDEVMVGFAKFSVGYARGLLGESTKEELDAYVLSIVADGVSPRLHTLICQLVVEVYCARGFYEDALVYFQKAADSVLIDVEWVERCPSLKPLASLPGFGEARRKVRARVQSMWSV